MTGASLGAGDGRIGARPAGFFRDLISVAGRALRAIPREPEALIPALIVPIFFFVVNVGSLSDISSFAGVEDFEAFQLPVAIVFAVTGISRASALVTDIQSGYFDRLLVSPVNRYSLLIGLMVADLALVIALSLPVLALWGLSGPPTQTLMTRHVSSSEPGQLQGANASLTGISELAGPLMFGAVFAYFVSPGRPPGLSGAPFLLSAVLLAVAVGVGWASTRNPLDMRHDA